MLSPVEKMLTVKAVARRPIKKADTKLWTTTTLNLWTRPDKKAKKVGEIEGGKKVLVTGRKMDGREEIVLDGKARWVTAGYLSADKPFAIGGDCTNGTLRAVGRQRQHQARARSGVRQLPRDHRLRHLPWRR